MSTPSRSNDPSAQQKSRCMSTISSAVCAGSTISESSVKTCLPATSIMAVVERRARGLSRSATVRAGPGQAVQQQGLGHADALEHGQVQALVRAVRPRVRVLDTSDEDLRVREDVAVGGD